MAYGAGAVGSLLGALLSFLLVSWARGLPPVMAAKCVAATAATYVGGTVNFFQVARAVGLEREGGPAVLGALAAADGKCITPMHLDQEAPCSGYHTAWLMGLLCWQCS